MNLFIKDIIMTIVGYLKADWWILLIGISIAVFIEVYISEEHFKSYIEKNSKVSILGSITFGAFTPLCACGTMAVLLSMFITAMPWGAVMAFLVSSPLTSPSEFMFQSAFFGYPFAVAVLVSSVTLGLTIGVVSFYLERHTDFFKDQFRLRQSKESICCLENLEIQMNDPKHSVSILNRLKIKEVFKSFYSLGIRKVLLYFIVFIAIGRIVELIIPERWILSLFAEENMYSIPLGATIGLPLYVSGSAALPLMKSFMNSGAGAGVMLTFLITGKATGIPVIAGMMTILRKKAILFYVLFVYFGGIFSGVVYQMILHFL